MATRTARLGVDGDDGAAATIAVGNVSTVANGQPATVTNTGTASEAVFDFEIPAGADGDPGTNGNTILTTSGAPDNGTGADGDYAYDPTAKIMYGPKAAGAWPAGQSLSGAGLITRTWSCSNVIAGSSPITPAYMVMGGAMTTTPATSPIRRERAIIKMKPIAATVQGVAGSGTGVIRFEIYVEGSATGDYVECGNNTTGLDKTAMPVQGTIEINEAFDLRMSITSGSTVSAMTYVSVTVLFEELP